MILFVHRKDLRINDLPIFDYIYDSRQSSIHLFILDPNIIDEVRVNAHSTVNFLSYLADLQQAYASLQKPFAILYGEPEQIIASLCQQLPISEVLMHEDYTPYAKAREQKISAALSAINAELKQFPDQRLVSLTAFHHYTGKSNGYKVFTPFFNKWREYLEQSPALPYTRTASELNILPIPDEFQSRFAIPTALASHLQNPIKRLTPLERLQQFLNSGVKQYKQLRDSYFASHTSELSDAINFGGISARTIIQELKNHPNESFSWFRQLAWREFYLYQASNDPLFFDYENYYDFQMLDDRYLSQWKNGETGIPLVDAAMTQLNKTGVMPNRLRMVTAMFLTKNLLCPFHLGEVYFRLQLRDYDRMLNRGGWLWSSSLGYDEAPYFRIMNPVTQSETHDPTGLYIRQWLPHLAHLSNKEIHLPQAHAIVDLKASRTKAIEIYAEIIGKTKIGAE